MYSMFFGADVEQGVQETLADEVCTAGVFMHVPPISVRLVFVIGNVINYCDW